MHYGGGTGSNRGGLRHRGRSKGEAKAAGKDEGRRYQEGQRHQIPSILGALLDILPRCIDRTDEQGEALPGYYSQQLTETIGSGAYDNEGHRNETFLQAKNVGPFPEACGKAWRHIREEVMENYELREGSRQEEWGKIGPLKDPTPANARNRGAADRKRGGASRTRPISKEAGNEMQGRGRTSAGRDQQPERREAASSNVREVDRGTQATRGTHEADIQGAHMEHAAIQGEGTQENSTTTPAQAAH